MACLNHVHCPLPYIKLDVQFELGEADRAKSAVWMSQLEGAIRAIKDAFIVDAVLESEHVANLMHHGRAASLHPDLLKFFLSPALALQLLVPTEGESAASFGQVG